MSVSAQDVPPAGAQPPTPIGMELPTDTDTQAQVQLYTLDLTTFCQTGQTGQESVVQGPVTEPHPSLAPGTRLTTSDPDVSDMVVRGQFDLPIGSKIAAIGPEAWFTVTEGIVAVVSCSGDLLFDLSAGDDFRLYVPAGTGVLIDSSFLNGVYLPQFSNQGYVWVLPVDNAPAAITMEVKVAQDRLFCDLSVCFWLENVYQVAPDVDTTDDGSVIGGGGSCGIRCYGR